jgi:hypothetical protein
MKRTFPTFHAAIEAGFRRDSEDSLTLRRRGPQGWIQATVIEERLP